jgi:hypothetical protein
MFTSTLPDRKSDLVGRLSLDQPDVHVNMTDILCEGATGTCDADEARLYGNGDALGDVEFFSLEDVPHLARSRMSKSNASLCCKANPAHCPAISSTRPPEYVSYA